VTWTLHESVESFDRFRAAWDQLDNAQFRSHPLLASGFVAALVKHFGAPGDVLALHTEGATPDSMMILRRRRLGVWSTFLPSQTPLAPAMVAANRDLHDLLSRLPGINIALELLCQDPLYVDIPQLAGSSPADVSTHVTTVSVALDGSFADYWQQRDAKLRENMRRYLRRAESAGSSLRLDLIISKPALLDALARFGEMESAGWKGRNGTAIHPDNAQGRFYADVFCDLAESSQVRMYELRLGEALLASQIAINNRHSLVLLKTTYDETRSNMAPGRLLLQLLIEREFNQHDFRTIEFYTKAGPEDIKWCTDSRHILHVVVFRSRAVKELNRTVRRLRQSVPRT
jgi:CelD/BcsL family acetyltransferase involved in cellulose biosynthesis